MKKPGDLANPARRRQECLAVACSPFVQESPRAPRVADCLEVPARRFMNLVAESLRQGASVINRLRKIAAQVEQTLAFIAVLGGLSAGPPQQGLEHRQRE